MTGDRASPILAGLAIVVGIANDATSSARPTTMATNPVETATAAPTQTARVEVRWRTPHPTRTATLTSTPIRYRRTRIARQTEAAVLRTATAILGRTPTTTPFDGVAVGSTVEVGDDPNE